MVLDAKAMGWAGEQKLDTATLKKAKVPIFGKWYFPDLPPGVPLLNLETGQIETFPPGFRAGATLYVKEEDLKRARLGPYTAPPEPVAPPATASTEVAAAPTADPAITPSSTRTAGLGDPGPAGSPTANPAVISGAPTRTADVRGPQERPFETQTTVAASSVPMMDAVGQQETVDMLHRDRGPERAARGAPAHGSSGHATDAAHAVGHPNTHEQAHPGPRTYVTIAIILAIITGVEVATYYIPAFAAVIVPVLLVLSAVKFFLVAAYFMHLKFDHTSFSGYFGGGLAIAASIVVGLIFLFKATPYGGGH